MSDFKWFTVGLIAILASYTILGTVDTIYAQEDLQVSSNGIALTSQETIRLEVAENERIDGMKMARQKRAAIIRYLTEDSGAVLDALNLGDTQRAAQEEKVATAVAIVDLIYSTQYKLLLENKPTPADVRHSTLADAVSKANELVDMEQGRLDALDGTESQEVRDARQAALESAQTSLTDAQAALDTFNVEHPKKE